MAALLGKATRKNRQGGYWWYCCQGHDGIWKDYIRTSRKGQRRREDAEWREEMESTMEEPKFFIATMSVNWHLSEVLGVFDTYQKAKAVVVARRDAEYPEAVGVYPEWSTSAYWYTSTAYGELSFEIDAYEMNVEGRWYGDSSE